MPSVYIVPFDNHKQVEKMFEDVGWEIENGWVHADLVCFTGGADVSPDMYGEKNEGLSHCDVDRDDRERDIYLSLQNNVPMVGICRGGQFLNVMNGGRLVQHIDGHGMRVGKAVDPSEEPEGIVFDIHEDHHQAIVPTDEAIVLLRSLPWSDWIVEACWYPETKSLCFQPHPEWGHRPTKDLFFDLIEEYIGLKA